MIITSEQLNDLIGSVVYSTGLLMLLVWVVGSLLAPVALHFINKKFENLK